MVLLRLDGSVWLSRQDSSNTAALVLDGWTDPAGWLR